MIVGMAPAPWWRRPDPKDPPRKADDPEEDAPRRPDGKDEPEPPRPLSMQERMAQLI